MSLLELKDVSYYYAGTQKEVLTNLNAAFELGKLYCIVGKSGAGKSTLLSLLSGLDLCCGGDILLNGVSLASMDRDDYRAKKIGVIFQSYNLLLNATALENVVLSQEISGSRKKAKKQIAYELLNKVGINQETANRKVLKLSGGEQQRVGIARALTHNPDLILADEPTGNLDADTAGLIMQSLEKIAHDDGKCVIIVTHSADVANLADMVYRIDHGQLTEEQVDKDTRHSHGV